MKSPLRKSALTFVLAGAFACPFGATSVAEAEPSPALPDLARLVVPPGRFANLDTHRLYYRCTGRGRPVLVIDHGIGGAAVEWTPVQEALASVTRVCTFDRAGYGWSDTGPGPRTTERSVAELRELLQRAGEAGPFLLVGHSFGGFDARYFASKYPHDVAGLALIESSHPASLVDFAGPAHAARHGIDVTRVAAGAASGNSHAVAASFLNSRRKAIFAQMDELSHFADSAESVTAAGEIAPIPLLVVARGDGEAVLPAREQKWRELQSSLARLSPHGEFVLAPSPSHDLHLDAPDFIIDRLTSFVARVRQFRRGSGNI